MVDTEKILKEVQQGNNPAQWKVFRGKSSPLKRATISGLLTLVFMLVGGSIVLFVFSLLPATAHLIGIDGPFAVVQRLSFGLIVYVIVTLLIACSVSWFVWWQAAQIKSSLFIIIPEGVVECRDCRSAFRRSLKTISYVKLADINLRIDPTSGQSKINRLSHPDSWLVFHYLNGSHDIWRLDWRYGNPETIAHHIIAGYAQYVTQNTNHV